MTLERQGTSFNYSTFLPAGTVIQGNSTWDGILTLPTIVTTTSSSGTVNVAVEMGSSQRLNFSNATKITLGGMANKSALWKDSDGVEHTITACDATANDTSEGTLTSGECYLDSADDQDLIIWTFHFTIFGAYTPTVATTTTTSSGGWSGCKTNWTCTAWTECSSGTQTRTCSYPTNFCKPTTAKPIESQSCGAGLNTTGTTNEGTTSTTGTDGVATTDAGEKSNVWIWIVLGILVLAIMIGAVLYDRNKKKN